MARYVPGIGRYWAVSDGDSMVQPINKELLDCWIEDARRSLSWFGEFVFRDDKGRPLRAACHHEIWTCAQEGIENGDFSRVLTIAPPSHAKSEWGSKVFPSWFLGKHPDKHLICASATASLANLFSVAVRDAVEQNQDYRLVFPEARPDKSKGWAEAEWFLWRKDRADKDASYTAAGVDGPVIGRRADGVIVDDPYNEEIANSPTSQRRVKLWFQRTLMSRLKKDAWALVIMTRWVPDDLAQDLIAQGWLTIHMPALSPDGAHARIFGKPEDVEKLRIRLAVAGFTDTDDYSAGWLKDNGCPDGSSGFRVEIHPGEALWPEEHPKEELERLRGELGEAIFDAMYQGNTRTIRAGRKFKGDWFKIIDLSEVPANIRSVRYWDLAGTEPKPGKDPDWTAGAHVGEANGKYYILDVRRKRAAPYEVEEFVRATAAEDTRLVPIFMEQEPGSSGKNTIDHYAREVLKGFAFVGRPSTGSKELRANPLSAAAQAGNVYLVRGAWNNDFIAEAESFPYGKHDDQMDAASGAVDALNTDLAAPVTPPGLIEGDSRWRR